MSFIVNLGVAPLGSWVGWIPRCQDFGPLSQGRGFNSLGPPGLGAMLCGRMDVALRVACRRHIPDLGVGLRPKIPWEERICNFYDTKNVEDEK